MNRDKPDGSTIVFPALAVFRGIYQRVASKLGVDPSFVSRVARGERKSPAVLSALQEEMNVIREHLNDGNGFLPKDGQFKNGESPNGSEDGSLNGGFSRNATERKGAAARNITKRRRNKPQESRAAD